MTDVSLNDFWTVIGHILHDWRGTTCSQRKRKTPNPNPPRADEKASLGGLARPLEVHWGDWEPG
jgi:hypothetical protein